MKDRFGERIEHKRLGLKIADTDDQDAQIAMQLRGRDSRRRDIVAKVERSAPALCGLNTANDKARAVLRGIRK